MHAFCHHQCQTDLDWRILTWYANLTSNIKCIVGLGEWICQFSSDKHYSFNVNLKLYYSMTWRTCSNALPLTLCFSVGPVATQNSIILIKTGACRQGIKSKRTMLMIPMSTVSILDRMLVNLKVTVIQNSIYSVASNPVCILNRLVAKEKAGSPHSTRFPLVE